MLRFLFLGGHGPLYRFYLRAFSLIESAIVLGVAGLVIGGIWIAAAAINETRAINQAVNGIMLIDDNLNRAFGGRSSALTIFFTSTMLDGMGILNGADGFTSSGGNPVPNSLMIISYESPGHSRFTFYSGGNLPTAFCIKLVSRLTARGVGDKIFYVWLTGAPNKVFNNSAFPVIPTPAQCTNSTSIDIQFK